MKADFFYVFIPNYPELAVADAPHDPELGKRIRAGGWFTDWALLNFELGVGVASDYLANSFAFRLCSERLRDVLEQGRGTDDTIQWLPAVVHDSAGQRRPYWVLHFPEVPPVIDLSKTKMAGPVIVKAVLDANLVDGHRVYSFPKQSHSLVIAHQVKASIEEANCTGIEFSKVPMA